MLIIVIVVVILVVGLFILKKVGIVAGAAAAGTAGLAAAATSPGGFSVISDFSYREIFGGDFDVFHQGLSHFSLKHTELTAHLIPTEC